MHDHQRIGTMVQEHLAAGAAGRHDGELPIGFVGLRMAHSHDGIDVAVPLKQRSAKRYGFGSSGRRSISSRRIIARTACCWALMIWLAWRITSATQIVDVAIDPIEAGLHLGPEGDELMSELADLTVQPFHVAVGQLDLFSQRIDGIRDPVDRGLGEVYPPRI